MMRELNIDRLVREREREGEGEGGLRGSFVESEITPNLQCLIFYLGLM